MNPSDKIVSELIQAKSRQRLIYGIAGLGVLLSAFLVWGVFVFSNGVSVEVLPDDASQKSKLAVVGGIGFAVGKTAYSAFGPPTIRVSSPGFRTENKALTGNDVGRVITVKMTELPGTLLVSTMPTLKNTRWVINGRLVGVSGNLEQKVFSGKHGIEIDNPHYQKENLKVETGRGETKNLSVNLQKINGHISIVTSPIGGSVYIDGEKIGKSPVKTEKNGGVYQIEVRHPGYEPITDKVEITNLEAKVERKYRLAHKQAYLNVSFAPKGGVLLINGKQQKNFRKIPVKANVENTLTYSKEGYYTKRTKLKFKPDDEKNISLKLQPEIGIVGIHSVPKASAFVNSQLLGGTPINVKLQAIPHKIEIRKVGYRTQSRTITPSAKSVQKFSVKLETELASRLRESPKEFKNSIGVQLKLFQPNDKIILGAPRHEKGQRANEFLRTVRLTKPFYIGMFELTGEQFSQYAKKKFTKKEPVSSVSWIEAAQFCNWLSQKEGLVPFYRLKDGVLIGATNNSDGYRLPTEAEWEWLARKAKRKSQVKFTWGGASTIPPLSGNIADEKAKGITTYYVPNYTDGYSGVAPVGSYPAEASGLHDFTGNVSEWMHDVYSLVPPDEESVEINPLGPNTGNTHVVKGSNWRSGNITELRASYREGAKAGSDDIGFRIARYLYGGPYVKD